MYKNYAVEERLLKEQERKEDLTKRMVNYGLWQSAQQAEEQLASTDSELEKQLAEAEDEDCENQIEAKDIIERLPQNTNQSRAKPYDRRCIYGSDYLVHMTIL